VAVPGHSCSTVAGDCVFYQPGTSDGTCGIPKGMDYNCVLPTSIMWLTEVDHAAATLSGLINEDS